MNDDGIPFSNVFDRKRDDSITAATEAAIAALSRSAAKKSEPATAGTPIANIVIMLMIVGNFPLQGIIDAVMIAISRSRLLSIILAPVIPQALQPRLIHRHKACLPHAPAFLNALSRLNAILGSIP